MITAYVVAGIGVLLLVVLGLTVRPRLRRLRRVVAELRAEVVRAKMARPAVNSLRRGRERPGTRSSTDGSPERAA